MIGLKQTLVVFSLLLLLGLFVFSRTSFGQEVSHAALGNDGECIQSFDTFAFLGPDNWSERQTATYSNWQMESSIPSYPDNVSVEYPIFALDNTFAKNEGR